jgi:hypothetical protein
MNNEVKKADFEDFEPALDSSYSMEVVPKSNGGAISLHRDDGLLCDQMPVPSVELLDPSSSDSEIELLPNNPKLLVCNHAAISPQDEQFRAGPPGQILIISITTVSSFVFYGWVMHLMGLIPGVHPVLAIVLMGLLTVLTVSWLVRKVRDKSDIFAAFPSGVLISDQGISLTFTVPPTNPQIGANNITSPLIPWTAIEMVKSESKSEGGVDTLKRGTCFTFRVRCSQIMARDAAQLKGLVRKLWNKNLPDSPHPQVNGITDRGAIEIEFPLNAITLQADKHLFVSAIKKFAPSAAVGLEAAEIFSNRSQTNFTQFWLTDFVDVSRRRQQKLQPGETLQLERYRIMNTIATGGQSQVYKALDLRTGQAVAIKELVLPTHGGEEVRKRSFSHVAMEIALLAGLDHPEIVKLRDTFIEDHRAYLILEHIDGKTLRNLIDGRSSLPVSTVYDIAIKMCSFLEYLHNLSPPVVHRDLTPDNVICTENGEVKLIDFNVAVQLESQSTKTVVGMQSYMAPEQFRGQATTQSDLYSFGCTLHFLLTGYDPVPLSSSHPHFLRPDIRNELDDIVAQLTALDLKDRYQTVADVRRDLLKAASSG